MAVLENKLGVSVARAADLQALEEAEAVVGPVVPHVAEVARPVVTRTHRVLPPERVLHPRPLHVAPTCHKLLFHDASHPSCTLKKI